MVTLVVLIRLACFGLLGGLSSMMGYGINTWQFWAIMILTNIIYCCSRTEEYNFSKRQ